MSTAVAKPVAKGKKPNSNCKEGSTRMRMFKALYRNGQNGDGLQVSQIKETCGMLPHSGHLFVLLQEEVKRGRVVVRALPNENDVDFDHYRLTAKGRKAFETNDIDKRQGKPRIGREWSKDRIKAEKKPTKKTAKK